MSVPCETDDDSTPWQALEGATLLALEVDRWRLIQELLGSAAGEIVARHLAQAAQAELRPTDACHRTGPGQFLLVLRDAGPDHAEQVALRVRRSLQKTAFVDLGAVTVSGAVALRFPGESVGQWWKRLDSTLAQARAGGGDHVLVDRRRSEFDPREPAPGLHLGWQKRFECGEPTIDSQHRELFELSESVLDAARRGEPQTGRISALVSSVRHHFTCEEAILARLGFPDLERHAHAHRKLLEKLLRLQGATLAGRASRDDLLRFLLGEVVADHMLSEDRLFAQLVRGAQATGHD